MTPTAEEKMWLVMEAIASGFDITPEGKHILINPDSIKISKVDLSQILEKLATDKKLIEIISKPVDIKFDISSDCYEIKIINQSEFRKFLNFAHSRNFGTINRMAGDNFFAICDVAMDILSELQLASNEVIYIMTVPSVVKFPSLCPVKSVNTLDRYLDFRMKALAYMKEREYIIDFEVVDDMYESRWNKKVGVTVDRYNFEKFYQQLGETYEVRVVKPAKEQEKKKKNTKEPEENSAQLPTKIEITAMPELLVRNTEDATISKGKKRIRLPKFNPTDWSKITLRFLSDRDVIITADKKQVTADYASLGFADEKQDKPNTAWAFLLGLANNNGETETLQTPISDTIRQQKRQVADKLKTLFKNDTDPFYDPTESHIYKIKVKLIPPQAEDVRDDFGVQEYLKDTATEQFET